MVVGKKQELICKLLYILSYFIRCSEVYENIESLEEIRDEELDFLDQSMDKGVFGDMSPIKEDHSNEVSPKQSVGCIDDQKKQDLISDFIAKCDTRYEADSVGALPDDTAVLINSDSSKLCVRYNASSVCSKSNTTASAFGKVGGERTSGEGPFDSNSTYQAVPNLTFSNCDNAPSPRNYDSDDTLCSTTKSDLTVDMDSSDGEIRLCKLSPLSILTPQIEDTRHVRRENLDFLKTDNVSPVATDTNKDNVNESPTKKYMRLPSRDEVIANDLDELFDEHTPIGMICDADGKFHGIVGSETRDVMQRSDISYAESVAFQSMTDSQYSSGNYSVSSCRTHPYITDSDQADSLLTDSYQREDSLDLEEPLPEKFADAKLDTVKEQPTLNIAEILKQRSAAVADTPLSPTLYASMSPRSCSSPAHSVTCVSPALSGAPTCMSPTQSEKSDDIEREVETFGSPPRLVRSRNSSGDKPPIIRQTSRSNTPGRTRSVTPTELGRRRNPSSASTADSDAFDPFLNLKEMPMPR
jgi:hypothetical protein